MYVNKRKSGYAPGTFIFSNVESRREKSTNLLSYSIPWLRLPRILPVSWQLSSSALNIWIATSAAVAGRLIEAFMVLYRFPIKSILNNYTCSHIFILVLPLSHIVVGVLLSCDMRCWRLLRSGTNTKCRSHFTIPSESILHTALQHSLIFNRSNIAQHF